MSNEIALMNRADKIAFLNEKMEAAKAGNNHYEIPYGDQPLSLDISADILAKYENAVIDIMDEYLRMELDGELTPATLKAFHQYVNKRDEQDDLDAPVALERCVFYAFAEGGFMYKAPIFKAINQIGKLNGFQVKYEPTWLLVYLPVIQQAVFAPVEKNIGSFNDKDKYLSASWYLLRSLLYLKAYN
ncbi:MAG: hypothetical protein PUB39_06990 [Eubacteriales bacterium]|nr:hypothetical protein [Eubacteriales bacterium]